MSGDVGTMSDCRGEDKQCRVARGSQRGGTMTAVALTREPAGDALTPEDFIDALGRVLSGSSPSSASSVALVALLDDGFLEAVVEWGIQHEGEGSRHLLWSDPDWSGLVQLGRAQRSLGTRDRTLVPVMLGPVLYGAIDWRGPLPSQVLAGDVEQRAASEFLAPLIKRIGK